MAARFDGSTPRSRHASWVAWLTRRSRGLGALALSLTLVVGAIILLGSNTPSHASGLALAPQSAPSSSQTGVGTGKPLRIARADIHAEARVNGNDMEINLAITQTQNDCLAPIKGGVCLRYSVSANEEGVLAGYGVIPATDIQVTPNRVALKVDTSKVDGFKMSKGQPVMVDVTWQAAPGTRVGAQQNSGAEGYIGPYTFSNLVLGALSTSVRVGANGVTVSDGDQYDMVATIIAE